MTAFDARPDYRHGQPAAVGVVVVNLGTPDAPTTAAVRRYLAEFLGDPRVVELPRILWLPILHGFILRTRPRRSAAAYRQIWTEAGSPLWLHSRAIAEGVGRTLEPRLPGRVHVEPAMAYGNPSIPAALARLYERGVQRIVVLPLYPQYSGTTTGTVFDRVTRCLAQRRWVPEFRFVNHYHDAPGYIAALAASVRAHWAALGRGERLLMSFHGVPRSTLLQGDPYHCHCRKTARLLAEALGLRDDEWLLTFQSRVGRAEWLTPYTDVTLEKWGAGRAGLVDVICPGFAADCLETLEEIALQNAGRFRAAGGGDLRYIPALNAGSAHVAFLSGLVEANLAGWPEADPSWSEAADAKARELGRVRALEMGAEC